MSAALNIQGDMSSSGSMPDISLSSLPSTFSTPVRPGTSIATPNTTNNNINTSNNNHHNGLRLPSTSSGTTVPSSAPLSTPSPPAFGSNLRRKSKGDMLGVGLGLGMGSLGASSASGYPGPGGGRLGGGGGGDEDAFDDDDALYGTPAAGGGLGGGERENKRWTDLGQSINALDTPSASRVPKRGVRDKSSGKGAGGGVTLTLRDQEKHIDNLKKENFSIKLRVHFLEERLAQLAPDQIDAALKQNINLKIEVQQRGLELKKLKKLVLELEKELERLQSRPPPPPPTQNTARERELEQMLLEREREIKELRRKLALGSGMGGSSNGELNELEDRNRELEEQLENARTLLEENMDEIDRLRDIVESQGHNSNNTSTSGNGRAQQRRMEELQVENRELRARLDQQAQDLAAREDEKDDLVDEINTLQLTLEDVQRRREAEAIERSESRAMILEEREEREAVQEDMNQLRDRLAAVMIELQQKEEELEERMRDIDELVAEHQRIVENVEESWRGEVEEARNRVDELKDVLAERESEAKELRLNISELESNTEDLHVKFEAALAHLEKDAEEKDAALEEKEAAIEKLGEAVYVLEDENDRMKEELERLREDAQVEHERAEALQKALKEKVFMLKNQLSETTEMYETVNAEIHQHRARSDELTRHLDNLAEELERERTQREHLQSDLSKTENEADAALRREKRALEAKESALTSTLDDLARAQSLLAQRDEDLKAVQSALQAMGAESKKAGESHTTARFSLQLEVDRLKRDLERVEDELARARKEIEERESRFRDRDGSLDKLYTENRDLAAQLSVQTQARLNLSEKLDGTMSQLKTAEGEVRTLKEKCAELEGRLSKDQRTLLNAENTYRDQLTERNTLLLTIYQYMDKILGVDKTPKKSGQAETKPFTNFSVFHDNLITRLKQLSQIQLDFDKRVKETENRLLDRLNEMRKQLDTRWKQIDKFETSVKAYAEAKAQWRKKLSAKEGELEAIKASNVDMAAQLSSIKRPGQSDAMEVRALTARATNAERRLINAQNQLLAAEEKMSETNRKTVAADSKWEARVREYEARLKAAEERVKRERQGGKERHNELENEISRLKKQLDLATKRNEQLGGLLPKS